MVFSAGPALVAHGGNSGEESSLADISDQKGHGLYHFLLASLAFR